MGDSTAYILICSELFSQLRVKKKPICILICSELFLSTWGEVNVLILKYRFVSRGNREEMGAWVPCNILLCRFKNKDLFLCKLVFNIELPLFMHFNEQLVLHYQWLNEVLYVSGFI